MISCASRTRTAAPETVLVDARPLQGGAMGMWDGLLQTGRAALPGVALEGLIDPAGPPLKPATHALFDAVRGNAYGAGRPDCLVRLTAGDPLFVARLIQTVPSVTLTSALPTDRLERAVAAYWLQRSEAVVDRTSLWPTVRRVMRPGRMAGLTAVFTTAPTGALAAALAARGARIFGAELIPLLSPRFGRTLFIIEGQPGEAGLRKLLQRYGGDVVLTGTCLLAADDDGALELAAKELGRTLPPTELAQWRAGIARPGALLLGAVAGAARELFVPSAWVAASVRIRFGRESHVVPIAATPMDRPRATEIGSIAATATGLHAEACVWALELLRFWGLQARLVLDGPDEERAVLMALADRLGVADRLEFGAERGAVTAALAMRGDGRGAAGLVAALASGRCCVASQGLAESIEVPPWLGVIPDQASPPLLAAALRDAMTRERPPGPTVTAWAARHAPGAVAASLL